MLTTFGPVRAAATLAAVTVLLAGCTRGADAASSPDAPAGPDNNAAVYSNDDLIEFWYLDWEIKGADDPTSSVAESWELWQPGPSDEGYSPAECVLAFSYPFLTRADDAGDEVTAVVDFEVSAPEDLGVQSVSARAFDSAAEARDFVAGIDADLAPCFTGYRFSGDDWTWEVSSLTVREATAGTAGTVLVVAEDAIEDTWQGEDYGASLYTSVYWVKGNVAVVITYSHQEPLNLAPTGEMLSAFADYLDKRTG